jgi:DNA topoisomerase-1
MTTSVLILESPGKIEKLKKVCNSLSIKLKDESLSISKKNCEIIASNGHFRELAKKAGKDDVVAGVTKNYKPIFEVMESKTKIVTNLIAKAKKYDIIYLMADDDREGEGIAWHVQEIMKPYNTNFRRVTFNAIDEKHVREGIENYRELDMKWVYAQQARQVLDKVVGFKLSGFLMKMFTYKRGESLSAGRVQSVVLQMMVNRHAEIEEFESMPSWHGICNFKLTGYPSALNGCKLYRATESPKTIKKKIADKKTVKYEMLEYIKKEEVSQFWQDMEYDFIIDSYKTSVARSNPNLPFKTTTMLDAAKTQLGFKIEKTPRVAQELYEAGKITYMRTDCTSLAEDFKETVKDYILGKFGEKYFNKATYDNMVEGGKNKAKNKELKDKDKDKDKGKDKDKDKDKDKETTKPKAKAKVKDGAKPKKEKKDDNAQEAHEAIHPTDIMEVSIWNDAKLSSDAKRLYWIIWKRTVASLMTAAEFDNFAISLVTLERLFMSKAVIKGLKFDGFKILDKMDAERKKEKEKEKEKAKREAKDKDECDDKKEGEEIDDNGSDRDENDDANEDGIDLVKLKKMIEKCMKDPDGVDCKQVFIKNKWSAPPAHHDGKNIIKELEENGIGRPSTIASFVPKLRERNYIVEKNRVCGDIVKYVDYQWTSDNPDRVDKIKEEKPIYVRKDVCVTTEKGRMVSTVLQKYFEYIVNVDFTSNMEKSLDDITKGIIFHQSYIQQFCDPFLTLIVKTIKDVKGMKKVDGEGQVLGDYEREKVNFEITVNNIQYVMFKGPYGVAMKYLPDGSDPKVLDAIEDKDEQKTARKELKYLGLESYLKFIKKDAENIEEQDIELLSKLPMEVKEGEWILKCGPYGLYLQNVETKKNQRIYPNCVPKMMNGDFSFIKS